MVESSIISPERTTSGSMYMSDRSGEGSFTTPSRGGVIRNCFFSPELGLYVSKNLNLFEMSAVSILMSSTFSSHLTTSSKGCELGHHSVIKFGILISW